MTEAARNDAWQRRVHALLRAGLGAENIGLKLSCPADQVRAEISILRQEGRLRDVLRPKVKA